MAIDWYSVFRFLHIVTAIFAIGPHFVLSLMVKQMVKNPESTPTMRPLIDKSGLFPGIGFPLMLVTGLLMIALGGGGWAAFQELWISGSLAIILFLVIWNRARVDPALKAVLAAIQGGSTKPEEIKVLSGRLEAAFNVDHIAMVLIVSLMILKPTL